MAEKSSLSRSVFCVNSEGIPRRPATQHATGNVHNHVTVHSTLISGGVVPLESFLARSETGGTRHSLGKRARARQIIVPPTLTLKNRVQKCAIRVCF